MHYNAITETLRFYIEKNIKKRIENIRYFSILNWNWYIYFYKNLNKKRILYIYILYCYIMGLKLHDIIIKSLYIKVCHGFLFFSTCPNQVYKYILFELIIENIYFQWVDKYCKKSTWVVKKWIECLMIN